MKLSKPGVGISDEPTLSFLDQIAAQAQSAPLCEILDKVAWSFLPPAWLRAIPALFMCAMATTWY